MGAKRGGGEELVVRAGVVLGAATGEGSGVDTVGSGTGVGACAIGVRSAGAMGAGSDTTPGVEFGVGGVTNAVGAGADVGVYEVPATSHRTAVIVGLLKAPQLVHRVRL